MNTRCTDDHNDLWKALTQSKLRFWKINKLSSPPAPQSFRHFQTLPNLMLPFIWAQIKVGCNKAKFFYGSVVKNLPTTQEMWVWSLGREDPLDKEMTTHSSILAWEIPWIVVPGGLQSMGSQRVRHKLETKQQVNSEVAKLVLHLFLHFLSHPKFYFG